MAHFVPSVAFLAGGASHRNSRTNDSAPMERVLFEEEDDGEVIDAPLGEGLFARSPLGGRLLRSHELAEQDGSWKATVANWL